MIELLYITNLITNTKTYVVHQATRFDPTL